MEYFNEFYGSKNFQLTIILYEEHASVKIYQWRVNNNKVNQNVSNADKSDFSAINPDVRRSMSSLASNHSTNRTAANENENSSLYIFCFLLGRQPAIKCKVRLVIAIYYMSTLCRNNKFKYITVANSNNYIWLILFRSLIEFNALNYVWSDIDNNIPSDYVWTPASHRIPIGDAKFSLKAVAISMDLQRY